MRHPGDIDLALYSGGDLPFWRRWRIAAHIARCPGCRSEVEAYRVAAGEARRAADLMPEDVDWERLSQEMTGNIRVGLAAGQCVAPLADKRRTARWVPALVMGGLVILISGAWVLNMPPSDMRALGHAIKSVWNAPAPVPSVEPGPVLEVTSSGVELRENGSSLTMAPGAQPVTVTMSMQGTARARYVDADTGQVTIASVYAQ